MADNDNYIRIQIAVFHSGSHSGCAVPHALELCLQYSLQELTRLGTDPWSKPSVHLSCAVRDNRWPRAAIAMKNLNFTPIKMGCTYSQISDLLGKTVKDAVKMFCGKIFAITCCDISPIDTCSRV